jgi:microcystin-dependent protein
MSDPYVGEVRLVGFTFAPIGWALCDGRLLSIQDNSALYSLIGTTYGGNGENNFAVPDLRGRVPVHQSSSSGGNYLVGQTGGVESVTLTANQYPGHSHSLMASSSNANSNNPANSTVGAAVEVYADIAPSKAMNSVTVSLAPGGSLPHENIQPFQVLTWIIALNGIYPSRG